jgi:hypothetical protein
MDNGLRPPVPNISVTTNAVAVGKYPIHGRKKVKRPATDVTRKKP